MIRGLKVDILEKIDRQKYDSFLEKNDSTFFHSSKYLYLLANLIDAKKFFILVRDQDEIKGILPFFMKKSKFGNVVNSLPYFGSYGGIITEQVEIGKIMLEELNHFNQENQVLSSVIVENPFYHLQGLYEKYFQYNSTDSRFTQCTKLNKEKSELFNSFEKRVRWSIKKSDDNNIKVQKKDLDDKNLQQFFNLHKKNMKSKNAQFKSQDFFKSIKKMFNEGKDYNVFVGYSDEVPISFLLVFYHKNFTEYYMPAQDANFKHLQPASKLIWESMKESLNKKKYYYNFGGTPKNNQTLYRFKRGWNAVEYNYQYFIFRDLERIREIELEELKKSYQYFYIIPYDEIQNGNH